MTDRAPNREPPDFLNAHQALGVLYAHSDVAYTGAAARIQATLNAAEAEIARLRSAPPSVSRHFDGIPVGIPPVPPEQEQQEFTPEVVECIHDLRTENQRLREAIADHLAVYDDLGTKTGRQHGEGGLGAWLQNERWEALRAAAERGDK